ncbi:MAG: response regulator [Bdellovibrionales bacterium]
MALRVLLADESPTIKKVFQLALQDFAVEVKSVNVGLDVKHVVEEFHPDIVFADILLQKQNGYDVCTELKSSASTQQVPVVLMWSGFMDLDEEKFKASAADGRIEKPFDVQSLRNLIQTHVPKTTKQTLSEYLSFPKMPEFDEEPRRDHKEEPSIPPPSSSEPDSENVISLGPPPQPKTSFEPKASKPPPIPDQHFSTSTETPVLGEKSKQESTPSWDMESFEPISLNQHDDDLDELDETGFTAVSMMRKKSDTQTPPLPRESENDSWVSQDLSRFKMDDEISEDTPPVSYVLPDLPDSSNSIDLTSGDSKNYEYDESLDTDDIDLSDESTFSGSLAGRNEDLQIEDVPRPDIFTVEDDEPLLGFQRRASSAVTRQDIEQYIYDACQKHLEDVLQEVIPRVAREIIQKEVDKILKSE